MEEKYYLVGEVPALLEKSTEEIERLFLSGKLRPSIHLNSVELKPVNIVDGLPPYSIKGGMFEIENYQAITWIFDCSGDDIPYCDLGDSDITLCQYGESYRVTTQLMLDKDELLVSALEIDRFESESSTHGDAEDSAPTPDYLDPTHKYYAVELAAAVEVWLEIYGRDRVLPDRGHKEQIKVKLKDKGFSKEAIERIATVVNANKPGGTPTKSLSQKGTNTCRVSGLSKATKGRKKGNIK